MYNNFGVHITNIFKEAEKERLNLHHPYVGSEHLLLAILKMDKEMSIYFKEYNLTYDNFRKELKLIVGCATKDNEFNLYTPLLKRIINNALENAKEDNKGTVTSKHLVVSLFEEGEGIAIRLLIGMGIDIDELYDNLNKNTKLSSKKLEILETGVLLNETIDFKETVVGRDKEIDLIIETILRKKKNNPILIGEAGVGKTAIVEELVRRIERHEVPESLFNTKIISLEMGSLVSGTKYRGEFEEKLTKIIKELENNPDIILFIDEIHAMVNAGGAEGAITAGDIFKPALARGKIKCIGATTNTEYHKYFSTDKALMRRFEVINVLEPKENEVKDILLKVKKEYENHHQVIISKDIIDKIIYYTNKFISNKKNPDKAIDFLDSVCSKVKNENIMSEGKKLLYRKISQLKKEKDEAIKQNDYDKALELYTEELNLTKKMHNYERDRKLVVKEKDIIKVLENKTNLILSKEKLKFLDDIPKEIEKHLYNRESYVKEINNLVKYFAVKKEGMLKVLLEGEEYLGKSSLIKHYASFFPNANFIRIDLKEYKQAHDITKLIGTTQGYVGYNDEHLFSSLKDNNFAIILFDNYSYAHERIKELIKEILKESYIIDNKGEKISFTNTFIFITDDIEKTNKIGFANNLNSKNNNELFDLVDKVITFKSLTKDELTSYLKSLKVKNIEEIIEKSNYEMFNYKNVNKLIKENHFINN